MTNPFAIIPAKVRAALYFLYGTAGIAVGVAAVWNVDNLEKWTGSLVVVGTALGFTALGNTDTSGDDE